MVDPRRHLNRVAPLEKAATAHSLPPRRPWRLVAAQAGDAFIQAQGRRYPRSGLR
jgi:hypothetical protein